MALSSMELTTPASRDKLVAEIVRLRRSFSDCERCPAFIEKTVFDLMERARLSAELYTHDARVRNEALEEAAAAFVQAESNMWIINAIRGLKSKEQGNG